MPLRQRQRLRQLRRRPLRPQRRLRVPPRQCQRDKGPSKFSPDPTPARNCRCSKPLTTLGKPGVQVAVIAKRPQGHFITHVEGANFPVVNGKVLDAQAHQLNDHDIIELAGVKMEFFLKS